MNTRRLQISMTFSAFAAVLLLSAAASAAPVPAKIATPAAPVTYASFVSVCRDHHGNLDRRACRHNGRLDPQRVVVALR
jgi:hypothetical protein